MTNGRLRSQVRNALSTSAPRTANLLEENLDKIHYPLQKYEELFHTVTRSREVNTD